MKIILDERDKKFIDNYDQRKISRRLSEKLGLSELRYGLTYSLNVTVVDESKANNFFLRLYEDAKKCWDGEIVEAGFTDITGLRLNYTRER